MASYVRCLSIFILALSISFQINARESKFFSKVSKTATKTKDSISISPTVSQSLPPAPAPEPEVYEHGYGLYGRDDPYENTHEDTIKPTEKPVFGEEKYVPAEELYNENTSDENVETENEFQYPSTIQTHTKVPMGSSEKQGMSDTRFLENGKYYHDVNQDGKDANSFVENKGNEKEDENEKGYVLDKEGLSEATYRNVNGNGREKQGMSDTRFLENGKYYYDVNKDGTTDVTSFVENDQQNVNGRNEYVQEKQGMSDTRFVENGKYFYDVQNHDEHSFNSNENEQFQEEYHETNENHNNLYNNNNNNIRWNEGRKGNYGSTKKLPNEYDTMEEYDREQGYVDSPVGYVP